MIDDNALTAGLQAAMRHSTEPMALCDPHQADMPIIAVNAAFEAFSGYAAQEIIGRNCRFLQGPKTDRDTVRKMKACLQEGEGCIQWLLNYRKDGAIFWNLLFISPVYAADGRLLYFFSNQHDLAAEKPLEMDHVTFGAAHMGMPERLAFHDLLREMGRDNPEKQARALEVTLAGARQVATMTTRLEPGPQL